MVWAGLLCAGTVIAILPVTLRNHAVSGDWVPVHAAGGVAFYAGNNPNASGTPIASDLLPHWLLTHPLDQRLVHNVVAESVSGRKLGPAEKSAFWFREGAQWIREHPADWLRVERRKLGLFWNAIETWEGRSPLAARDFSWVMGLPLLSFGIAAPLALLGVAVTIRRWRQLFLLHAVIAVHLVASLMFFTVARDRVSVVPILLLFAAAATVWMWDALRARRRGALVASLAGLGLGVWIVHLPFGDDNLEVAYSQLGDRYQSLEEWDEAIDAYGKSLSYDPSNLSDWANLGVAFEHADGHEKDAAWVWNHVTALAGRFRLNLVSERAERHLHALGVEPLLHPETH
jgi:tetratricopeptide (TPR) repeat protein